MREVQIQEMQSKCLLSRIWRPASTSMSVDGEPVLWLFRAVREQHYRAENARVCHSVVPNSEKFTDQAVSVMARPRALVASLTMRFVHMKGKRGPVRQSFDQGELLLGPHWLLLLQQNSLTIHSYVQMLERQNGQLSAGLQELYRRAQDCCSWTEPRLEAGDHSSHKILEVLGVLHPGDWADMESIDHDWQSLEAQEQDGNDWDWTFSRLDSSPTQAAISHNSPTQIAFPQSEIMSKRQSKAHSSSAPAAQMLSVPAPLIANFVCNKPEPYSQAFLTRNPTSTDTFPPYEQLSMNLDQASGSATDWSLGLDDLFGQT